MTTLFLNIVVLFAAGVIVVRAEPALNKMSRCTPFMIRASFYLLTLGAAAEIVFILSGDVPSLPAAITTAGVAALLACERRLRIMYPRQRRAPQ